MRTLCVAAASLLAVFVVACGSEDSDSGLTQAGGAAGTTASRGGATATGGASAQGGSTAKGGATASGGADAGSAGNDGGEAGNDGGDAGNDGGDAGSDPGTGGKGGSSAGTGGKGGSNAGTGGKGGSSAGTGGKGGSSAGTGGKGGSTGGSGGASGGAGGAGTAGASGANNAGFPFIIVKDITGADAEEEVMIAEGVALANATMKTDCFRDFVLNATWTETEGLSQAQIWEKLCSGPVSVNVEMYTGSYYQNYVSKTIGYEDAPGELHMNRFFVDTTYEVASNIIHEAEGHTQGFSHYKVKATSVPYGLNDAFEACAAEP